MLDLPVELAQHLAWEVHITPTLVLRLVALEISASEWFAAQEVSPRDLWPLQEQVADELAAIRRRR